IMRRLFLYLEIIRYIYVLFSNHMYIYQYKGWPNFTWNSEQLSLLLGEVRFKQGRLLGNMERLGFDLQAEAVLNTLTQDVLKSSEIEGEILDSDKTRSSIARRLGMEIA